MEASLPSDYYNYIILQYIRFFAGMILDNIIRDSRQSFEMRLIDCERELKDRRKDD